MDPKSATAADPGDYRSAPPVKQVAGGAFGYDVDPQLPVLPPSVVLVGVKTNMVHWFWGIV